MKITSTLPSHLTSGIRLSPELEKTIQKPQVSGAESASFGDMLMQKINQVDEMQKTADVAVNDFATGKSRNLHEAVLALEMADTSLRMMVTVRNKAIEAYQEIMKLPI